MELRPARSKFLRDISQAKIVGLDSNILIYHLEDLAPFSELTEIMLTSMGHGRIMAVVSTISITELLTRPYIERDLKKVNMFRNFILALPHSEIIAPDVGIAQQAAYLRGNFGLRTPDALLLATSQVRGAGAFITNDARYKKVQNAGLRIVILDEYAI